MVSHVLKVSQKIVRQGASGSCSHVLTLKGGENGEKNPLREEHPETHDKQPQDLKRKEGESLSEFMLRVRDERRSK